MEFWGVEVKPGKPLKVKPDFDKLVHVSQAALGELKDVKGAKYVHIRLKIGTENYVIGSLSAEDRPQVMFDLVFEREFELSHDWKSGSVYFMGYIADIQASDEDDFFDESEDEEHPFKALENGGKVANKVEEVKAALKDKATAAASKIDESDDDNDDSDDEHALEALEIREVKTALKDKSASAKNLESDDDEDSSDDESDDEEDSSDVSGGMDFDEVMDASGSSGDEEMPKAGLSKKKPSKSVLETPVPAKKAKSATRNRTGNKNKSVHTATPFPSKKAGNGQSGKKAK